MEAFSLKSLAVLYVQSVPTWATVLFSTLFSQPLSFPIFLLCSIFKDRNKNRCVYRTPLNGFAVGWMVVSGVRLLIKFLIQSMPRKSKSNYNIKESVLSSGSSEQKHKNSPHYVIVLR